MTDVRPSLDPFYMTFGVQYSRTPDDRYGTERHDHWPLADGKGWVKIMAPNMSAANNIAHGFFGQRYAFLYPADRFDTDADREFYPLGELAVLTVGRLEYEEYGLGLVPGLGECWAYGHSENELVACRIIGKLTENSDADAVAKVGYDMEYTHTECFEAGAQLFASIDEVDRAVLAFELDWTQPYECPACHVSIT